MNIQSTLAVTTLSINEITQLSGIVAGVGQSRASDKQSALFRLKRQLEEKIGHDKMLEWYDKITLGPNNLDEAKAVLMEALGQKKEKKMPKAKKEVVDDGEVKTRGKTSKYAGKTIKASKAVAEKGNPRRVGTHGYRSMEVVIAGGDSGVSFEDYITGGGRLNDLIWDIEKGNVVVK